MQIVDAMPRTRAVTVAANDRQPQRTLRATPTYSDIRKLPPEPVVENGHRVWRVPCGDMIKRDRTVTVYVDNDEVVVVGPPGETARMSADQINQLRAVLADAAKLTTKAR